MRRLVFVILAALVPSALAASAAIQCESTADCGSGETCVAGDSVVAIQRCVAGSPCSGASFGNCPSDEDSGQLACIQRSGAYKCISIARCDAYFGGSACSGECVGRIIWFYPARARFYGSCD